MMSNIPKMGQLPTPEFELPFHRVSHNTMWNMQLVVTSFATIGFFGSSHSPHISQMIMPTAEGWASVPSSTHYVTIQTHPRCLQRCSRELHGVKMTQLLALHAFKIISLMGMSPSPQRFVTSGSRTDPVAPTWQNTYSSCNHELIHWCIFFFVPCSTSYLSNFKTDSWPNWLTFGSSVIKNGWQGNPRT